MRQEGEDKRRQLHMMSFISLCSSGTAGYYATVGDGSREQLGSVGIAQSLNVYIGQTPDIEIQPNAYNNNLSQTAGVI
jgi:hypothetical protein